MWKIGNPQIFANSPITYDANDIRQISIRLITPDQRILNNWGMVLGREGLIVIKEDIINRAASGNPELFLVELAVPGCAGARCIKELIRIYNPASIISFGDPEKISCNRICTAIASGANDFIRKDINEKVLVAKLKAHLRLVLPHCGAARNIIKSQTGSLEINLESRQASIKTTPLKDTQPVNLTKKELEILLVLVRNERKVISRNSLLEQLWGKTSLNVYPKCVDKHIESLRRKLGLSGKKIRTVYGTGYMYDDE